MTKKIEEAAREFMETAPIEAVSPYYEEDMIEMFRGGTAHLLSLPLSQRLTDEEREKIKANYADAKDIHKRCVGAMRKNHIADLHNEYNKGLNMGIIIALKHIFGKELFGEGEG